MATLPARILIKRGLLAQLDPGDLLDGEMCIITNVGTGALAYGLSGQNYFLIGQDVAAIEALTGVGFARRVADNSWVLTRPAPGDITQNGATGGMVIVWNGTTWAPAFVTYSDIGGIPTDFPPSTHTHPLTDLEQTGGTEGQAVIWRGPGAGNWIADTITLDIIGQSGATDGQVPVWDNGAGEWVPGAGGGGTVDPADIEQGDAVDGDILQWDNTAGEWDERTPDAAGIVTKAGNQSITGIKTLTGGSSGGTPAASSRLIIEDDVTSTISIMTPSNAVGGLIFSNELTDDAAHLSYDHTGEVFRFDNNSGRQLIFSSSGDTLLSLNSTDAAADLEIEFLQNGAQKAYLKYVDNGASKDQVALRVPSLMVDGITDCDVFLQTTTTTTTTLGDKDARVLLVNNSSTVGAGGEVVLGATGDTTTGRYGAIGSNIESNSSGAATGSLYLATKSATGDTTLTKRLIVAATGKTTVFCGGAASTYAGVGGVLDASVDYVANNGGGEDDLHSYTVPASLMNAEKDTLYFWYSVRLMNNPTSVKRVRVYFAGTIIYDSTVQTTTTLAFMDIRGVIIRENGGPGVYCSVIASDELNLFTKIQRTEFPVTFTNSNILKLTGESGGTGFASDDVAKRSSLVSYQPAP